MQVRVAIVDPLPVVRRGLSLILQEVGVEAEAPADLLRWVRDDQQKLIVLTLMSGAHWSLLEEVREADSAAVVLALLDDASLETYVRALRAGASAAIPRDASLLRIREAMVACLRGECVLPLGVVEALAGAEIHDEDPQVLSQEERRWLSQLAHGMTITRLANDAGYSERMMYRLLQRVYFKLGVENRVEAVIRARDEGWVT